MKTLDEQNQIMQEAISGKPIEVLVDGEWVDLASREDILWYWKRYDFRVKGENNKNFRTKN